MGFNKLTNHMKKKLIDVLKKKKYNRETEQEDISYKEVQKILKQEKNAKLVDVRSSQEYREGHLPNSINIPLYELEQQIEREIPQKGTTVIFCCSSGHRSRQAVELAKKIGYQRVCDIAGGMQEI